MNENPQTPMIIPPPKYVSPPSTWKSKLLLRAWSVLSCILIAALGGSIAAMKGVSGDFMIVLGLSLIVPFVWGIADGVCIYKRPGNRGIHPGAVVAIDLLIWLGLGFVTLLVGATGMASHPQRLVDDLYYRDGRYVGYRGDDDDDADIPELLALVDKIRGRGRAVVGFLAFLVITHFVIFVIGCSETHSRNRAPKTVYVVQPPTYANGQPQYQFLAAPGQYPQQQYYAPQQQQYYAPQQSFQPVPVQPSAAPGVEPKQEAQSQAQAGPERYS